LATVQAYLEPLLASFETDDDVVREPCLHMQTGIRRRGGA
jgi:hypothetical protein